MMDRRQFVYAATAGVVTLARGSRAFQPDYDMVVRGGRVIDPSLRVDFIGDVAIVDGRIAAIAANLTGDAAEVIDATGKIVVPGLLDVHTHYARDENGPAIGLSDGVTGWVDAGSKGADQIDEMVAIARSAPQPARVLINIGRAGILPDGDTMDLGPRRCRRREGGDRPQPALRHRRQGAADRRGPRPTTWRCCDVPRRWPRRSICR